MGANISESVFSSLRFDIANARVWRDGQRVVLRPKSLAVLRYLMKHAGRVVTKKELLRACWPDTSVNPVAVKVCIREIRVALQDGSATPVFIETVRGRGYRFIAQADSSQAHVHGLSSALRSPHATPSVVGRRAELEQLHSAHEQASRGLRQVVFVTGEPGIGKTTVVETFLAQLATQTDLCIARGQCIEQYGAGEAYMPVLTALDQLCSSEGAWLITLLRQHAPMWLAQLPSFNSPTEREALQRELLGATRERMLREMAVALAVLTSEKPLVLLLEDLHWSDYATLDLLAYVARRSGPARLLVIGTYRPVEVLFREHPLKAAKQELQVHGYCQELALSPLSEADVGAYLATRFNGETPHTASLQTLARSVHQRTEGNPLFMVNVVDTLIARGVMAQRNGQWGQAGDLAEVEASVPETLRHLIEQQTERLDPADQQVLEVASVTGMEFSAAVVAAAMETAVDKIERTCEGLAHREQFLRRAGKSEWPDGTVAARYAFIHTLYQNVLYERVTPTQRARLHRKIGERLETGYREQAEAIAVELALHFEAGRGYRKAVRYHQQAGETALRRYAHHEAIEHFTKGLQLVKTWPASLERRQQELLLHAALGVPLMMTKGYAAAEVEKAYSRARALSQQVRDTPQLLPILWGLFAFYLVRGEIQTAREPAEQLLSVAERQQDPAFFLPARLALGVVSFHLGTPALALTHLEQGMALYEAQPFSSHDWFYGQDLGVLCLSYTASALWQLGHVDHAFEKSAAALILARKLSHPFTLASSLFFAATLHQRRQERQKVQECLEATLTLSTEHEFPHWLAQGTILQGWVLAEQEEVQKGILQILQGLATSQSLGIGLGQPYYLGLLAEAYGKKAQIEQALSVLADALETGQHKGERWYEAELYRLKGELTLDAERGTRDAELKTSSVHRSSVRIHRSAEAEAEGYFYKAIEIARQQQAKSWELRAATSLARLWQSQGKPHAARNMLSESYHWFTEGFDTADLRDASVLLEELSR